MNTFLLQEDNQIVHTIRNPIMEKSNAVDTICFLVNKEYNGFLMKEFDLVMEYRTPISKKTKFDTLVLVDDNYKDDYLKYTFPSTTAITAEPGELEINMSMMKVELEPDGTQVKRVRNFSPTAITIVPITSWFTASDEALTQLAELYLFNKTQIEALKNLAEIIYNTKADDIAIDIDGQKIQLKNKDEFIGNGIPLTDLNQELVETGSATTGNINIVRI